MNRRAFVHRIGTGALGTFAAFDVPRAAAATATATAGTTDDGVSASGLVRVGNNENPYGPGPCALAAIGEVVANVNRYPGLLADDLVSAIAAAHDVPPDHILLSGGSGDIMRAAVNAFTSRTSALVTARPSYELPMRAAQHIGSPVIRVPLTSSWRLDVQAMGGKGPAAGLIYICNPNNPTSTAVTGTEMAGMLESVARSSPGTRILVDEAYFDYAEMPEAATMIGLITQHPQLIVTRTFSKVHGMAGMRVAYALAQPQTLTQIRLRHSKSSLSSISLAAAVASLGDTANLLQVRDLNRGVRGFMVNAFTTAGYQVAPADANFIFVNIRRDVRDFDEACRQRGVHIGRAFPPMSTWARISVGTHDEMLRAMQVFMTVLATPPRKAHAALSVAREEWSRQT